MKVRFYDINWDTDPLDDAQEDSLPKETTLDVDDDVDLELDGADVLSDKYGFCVFGFNYEVLDT